MRAAWSLGSRRCTTSCGNSALTGPQVADQPLRIAIVGRSVHALHAVGGLERHLYDLIRHHLAEGWQVTLITRPTPSGVANPAEWQPIADHPGFQLRLIPYRTFPFAGRRGTTILDRSTAYPWFGWRAGQDAARLVTAGRIDLVYGSGASAFGYARAHRGPGGPAAPLVVNPQGMEEFGGPDGTYGGHRLKGIGYAPLRYVARATAAAADAIIATDTALEPSVTQHLRVEAQRVHVIPNGLDLVDGATLVDAAAGRALRAAYAIEPREIVLLSVGRLEANKGFVDLVSPLTSLSPDTPWRWVIVGSGPGRAALEAWLDAAGLHGRVVLPGRVDTATLHAWYDAADLFVHPTRYEGSSLVTLEAMLHEKPVIATRVGGLPDKVLPGRTGWLVNPSDPAALVAALQDALAHRDRWAALGRAGRSLLEERFDWRVLQRAYRALYEELLQQAGGSRVSARAGGFPRDAAGR
jgi:glycogen(starch) synthase